MFLRRSTFNWVWNQTWLRPPRWRPDDPRVFVHLRLRQIAPRSSSTLSIRPHLHPQPRSPPRPNATRFHRPSTAAAPIIDAAALDYRVSLLVYAFPPVLRHLLLFLLLQLERYIKLWDGLRCTASLGREIGRYRRAKKAIILHFPLLTLSHSRPARCERNLFRLPLCVSLLSA